MAKRIYWFLGCTLMYLEALDFSHKCIGDMLRRQNPWTQTYRAVFCVYITFVVFPVINVS